MHLFPPTESDWIPKVLTCSSTINKGITEVYKLILEYKNFTTLNNYFFTKRKLQQFELVKELLDSKIISHYYETHFIEKKLVALNSIEIINPFAEVEKIIKTINN